MKNKYKLIASCCILMGIISCTKLKVGNLVSLGLPVETKLRSSLVRAYIDTSSLTIENKVPLKWFHLHKLDDIDSVYTKRVYFKGRPEEMYLLTFGGMLVLQDIYNPTINDGDWIADNDLLSKEDEERAIKRLYEFLNAIEKKAIMDGVPDSVIYRQGPFKEWRKFTR